MLSTLTGTPDFDGAHPPTDAQIWQIALSPEQAFKLLCDLGHLYRNPDHQPRVGGMFETGGGITLYLWPRLHPDSPLLLLLLDYGATGVADMRRWHGVAWVAGELLGRVLAAIVARQCEVRFREVVDDHQA